MDRYNPSFSAKGQKSMRLAAPESVQFRRLCRALKPDTESYGADAVVLGIMALWVDNTAPEVLCSLHLDGTTSPAGKAFVEWLAPQDVLTSAFWISTAYAFLVDKARRKHQAMYFTSPHLAQRLLDNASETLLRGPVIDPACGGAAFLAPAAVRMAKLLEAEGRSSKEILAYIQKNLHGVDVDPFLCLLTNTFLTVALAKHILAAGQVLAFQVSAGDGLSESPLAEGGYRLVLCNPPYRKMTLSDVVPYRDAYGELLHGQPNLYALFIARATKLLGASGVAVLLTPMSFLSGRSFAKLREELTTTGGVKKLDLIHEKVGVFIGAEQDTTITVWQKQMHKKATTEIHVLDDDGQWHKTGKPYLPPSSRPWPLPRGAEDAALLKLFSNPKHTLATYGHAPRIGLVVMHRHKFPMFSTLAETEGASCVMPLIWQSDVTCNGLLKIEEHGRTHHRYVDIGHKDAAGVIRRPAIAAQRVTSTDQPRRLVCATVPPEAYEKFGGVVGENHICFIEKVSDEPAVSSEFLCSILRTRIVDRLFRCMSGATNVSAYELSALPLPDPARVRLALLSGATIEDSVRTGFGLDPQPLPEQQETLGVA